MIRQCALSHFIDGRARAWNGFLGAWRMIVLVFDVVLLSLTWANAYFIRRYCLQDLHPLAQAKKLLLRSWLFLQTCSPRAGLVGFLYERVGFFYNFLKRAVYAKRAWFLVTRCLIVYYESLTYRYLGVGNGCGMITAVKRSHFKIMNISNKTFLVLMIGAASLAVFGPIASATTMQLTLDYGSRHSGDGGEFNATSPDFVPATMGYAAPTIYNGGFETFCVETNEFFNPGSTYYYSISQAAIRGGVGGGNPDPISKGTAWLYLNFAKDTLPGYDYSTMGQNTSAAELQATIWWLENETTTDPMNQFSMLVTNQFGSAANAMADNNGLYGVGVLNLWGDLNHTQDAQDQLVLVPDGGSTAMLLGLGLLGLFVGRWKLNRRIHAAYSIPPPHLHR